MRDHTKPKSFGYACLRRRAERQGHQRRSSSARSMPPDMMEISAAAGPEIVDPASKVVFFLMEYHQRVHTVGSSTGALLVVVKRPWVPPRMGGTRPMKARF